MQTIKKGPVVTVLFNWFILRAFSLGKLNRGTSFLSPHSSPSLSVIVTSPLHSFLREFGESEVVLRC